MKRILSLVFTLVFAFSVCPAYALANDDSANIELAENNTEFALEAAEIINNAGADSVDFRVIGKTKNLTFNFESFGASDAVLSADGRFVLQFESEKELLECLENLKSNTDTVYAERDIEIYTEALEETERLSWGTDAIEAHTYAESLVFSQGSEAVVAIVDSGCEDIDFIKDKIVKGFDLVDNDEDATNDTSTDSHGTFLASIITDCTRGIPVKIMPVRVLSSKSGSLINAVNGIYYAVDNGADVINISLGGVLDDCSSLDDALKYAEDKGVCVVVCAGNSKSDIANYCPAHIETAITVTSVNDKNEFSASFSNFGDRVDLAAPGEKIIGYNALGEIKTLSGTSMSAAFVSAAAAMYVLDNPGCTPAKVRDSLANSTEDFGEPGWDKYYGHGILRLGKLAETIFTAKWNVEGEVYYSRYQIGDAVTPPQLPQIDGCTFVEWAPDVPEKMPAEDLSFTAIYAPNSYNAVFDADGGRWAGGETVRTVLTDYNAQIDVPEPPQKQGYVFSEWSPETGKMDSIDGKTFTAQWLPASDTRYTVENYKMNASGGYEKSVQTFSGITDSQAKAEYKIEKGYTLNVKKSVLSGKIAPDGSLTLKVYIDRNTYTLTTVVDGEKECTEYLFGSSVAAPEAPQKKGWKFKGWSSEIPSTMPAADLTVTAQFNCIADVSIENKSDETTINYGDILKLTAITRNKPDGAKAYWYVEGEMKGKGDTFELNFESGTKTVEVKLVDANGNILCDSDGKEISDSQKVTVKSGFFQKLISFFKDLFKVSRTVTQSLILK